MSMLVPRQTLAGWPLATDPSPLQVLGLLLGLPALAFLLIVLLGKASSLARAGRGQSHQPGEPVWLGGPDHPKELTFGEDAGEEPPPGRSTGGASARW